jgi:hypothetical protein
VYGSRGTYTSMRPFRNPELDFIDVFDFFSDAPQRREDG